MTAIGSPPRSGTVMRPHSARPHKDAPDTVRALAAATVVLCHAIAIIWLPGIGLANWTHWISSFAAETAVIVFFVLSGYLISASIEANIARNRGFRVLDYALNRAVRIYPPLICAVVLSAVLFGVMAFANWPGTAAVLAFEGDLYSARQTVTMTLADLIDAMLMRNGLLLMNGALWSLYVEVKLYVAGGLLAFLLFGTPRLLVRAVVCASCLWLGRVIGWEITSPQCVYVAWWLLGAVMFGLARLKLEASGRGAIALTAVAVAIAALSAAELAVEAPRIAAVLAISYGMFFWWTKSEPVTKRLAQYSYTLYLVHFPILIFTYSIFVQVSGPHAPAPSLRIVVMLLVD